MTDIFRPSTIADEPAIIALMLGAFSAVTDDPGVQRATMDWKYWGLREDWSEPRSYVMERDGRIVAHAGVWPAANPTGGERPGVHLIDWAWDPQAPDAGLALAQELADIFSFVFTIGGTEATLELLGRGGFYKLGDAVLFARPIRPFRHALHHQTKDIRLPVRLVRNVLWSRSPVRGAHGGWEAVPTDPTEALSGAVLRERDARFFQYLKRCPAASCTLFKILRSTGHEGYFALATVERQARIAGVWMNDTVPEKWRIGFELAQDAALRHTHAYEIVARRSREGGAAPETAGMRARGSTPVLLYSKAGKVNMPPLEFQLVDNDVLFMYGLGFAC